jgi:hypothetical protein
MERLSLCLMFVLVFCLFCGCNTARLSGPDPQQVGGSDGRVNVQGDQEQAVLADGLEEVGKRAGETGSPGRGIEAAPFAEERLAHRPTRTGGMPAILNPKGVPYSEAGSLYGRE